MPENQLLTRLTNKVGPLPAWAWAAIPATGYIAWSYYRAAQGESIISDDTGIGGAEGTDAEDYGINTGGTFLPGYGATPGGTSNLPATTEQPRFDNQAWFRQASRYLIEQGFKSTDVVTALNAYINGFPQTVNATQLQALQRAILEFGPAPDPAFVPGTTPTPTPTPKPTVVTVPTAPTNVQARMHSINSALKLTTAIVSWGLPVKNGGAAIIGFKIEQRQQRNGKWVVVHVKQAGATARSIVFPVNRGEWNTFNVYALNSKGYGPAAYQSLRIP